jgi:hypothetical protein
VYPEFAKPEVSELVGSVREDIKEVFAERDALRKAFQEYRHHHSCHHKGKCWSENQAKELL